jgi:hypothetical protein
MEKSDKLVFYIFRIFNILIARYARKKVMVKINGKLLRINGFLLHTCNSRLIEQISNNPKVVRNSMKMGIDKICVHAKDVR